MLRKLFNILSLKERKQAVSLIFIAVIMALLDMIGVASIMPFIAVLANPNLLETNVFLKKIYSSLGVQDPERFRFFLGMVVFSLILFSIAFKAFATYVQMRFAMSCELNISKRLVEGYLRQPYSWFLNKNSAELGARILTDVQTLVFNGLIPAMNMVSQSAVAIAFLSLLLFVDPFLAITVGLFLGTVYAIFYKVMSDRLLLIGSERQLKNIERWTALSEVFGGIKEVKASGLEKEYLRRFTLPARIYARHQATANIISQFPRFVMEVLIFGGMLVIVLVLTIQKGGFSDAIPIISLYAFVGLRLMPALQQIYGSFSQLRFAETVFDALYSEFSFFKHEQNGDGATLMKLHEKIVLNDVVFTYPNAKTPSLKGITIGIDANSKVGIVGATGSGKTTLVDIVLGLLEPQHGTLEVDGMVIGNHNRRDWQRIIGYVPQNIFLADDTVAANIAFGVDPKEIDSASVERASKLANLHEFVFNQLPEKYETKVGERGIRLSGGQRQRIGIARALYHNPKVLILDEATSALDNITEQVVMDAIQNLGNDITTIMIAHRLSTVRKCDTIFLLERGELKAQGNFEQLKNSSELFHRMAH